jgi:hypothetical protein
LHRVMLLRDVFGTINCDEPLFYNTKLPKLNTKNWQPMMSFTENFVAMVFGPIFTGVIE